MALRVMTKIDLNNGFLYINGITFPLINRNSDGHTIANSSYSNMSLKGKINEMSFIATAFYKNEKIRTIHLSLEPEFLKKIYKPNENLDFNDYCTTYLDFRKSKTEELLKTLLNSNKRKFNWGKIIVSVDPRGPDVFSEIIYF
ncbi:hypothetical protein [Croceiramulus getboli]|nr:hypothetical protein P8624_13895 [Flavobacteriaceae bacterium YJPT1-3]